MADQELANIEIVRHSMESLNTGDTSKASEFIHPDYFNHESQASPERAKMRGPPEFKGTVEKLHSAFSNLQYKELELIASDNQVVVLMMVSGKHTGNFFGLEPTGRDFSYKAAHFLRMQEGKIREHEAIRDDLKFMMQLGIIGPGSPQYEPIFNIWKGMLDKSAL